MSSEVLIYLQKVKNYLETNKEANDYFLNGINSDDFFKEMTEQSIKNFTDKGDPMLNREQFEEIREKILNAKTENIDDIEDKIFFTLKDFGKICLN